MEAPSQIKSSFNSLLLQQISYNFAMPSSNPGQEPSHALCTLSGRTHAPSIPDRWSLSDVPPVQPHLPKQKLPVGSVCLVIHGQILATLSSYFSLKLHFWGLFIFIFKFIFQGKLFINCCLTSFS